MTLVFRDSLTGRSRSMPRHAGRPLTLYVCGPTVYDRAHVGHARTYLYFDLLRRYWRDRGVQVRHVMNLTDYEDKISARAQQLGLSWRALARREEVRFFSDFRRLETLPPHLTPRASDFVPEMVRWAKALVRRGNTVWDGDELYLQPDPTLDAENFPVGADFARHAVLEADRPEPQVDPTAHRFLLWRRQTPPAASWPSPWGAGAPGWHLECYALARRYLSVPVDVHGGGLDLIFPHHYAENAIALTLEGRPFARRYLHTGFVTQAGRKMSKSRGNLAPLSRALDDLGPGALRWYLLRPPYNQRIEWDSAAAEAAAVSLALLQRRVRGSLPHGRGGSLPPRSLERLARGIVGALEHGFGVDRAFGALGAWSGFLGEARDPVFARGSLREVRRLYGRIEALLGLRLMSARVGPESG